MRTALNLYRWARDNEAPDWVALPALAAMVTVVLLMADVLAEALKHTH